MFTVTYSDGNSSVVTPTSLNPSTWSSTVGTQSCTFSYTESGVTVSASKSASVVSPWNGKPVGGTIFYINTSSTNTYKFHNANDEEVSAPTVGTDCTGWTYEVTGNSVDKFYVYESTTGLVTAKFWGYRQITTSATGNSIGAGKTNTSTVLAITDTSEYYSRSMWEHIKNMRTNKTNGCDDWFIGCEAEYDLLRSSGTSGASWFSSKDIWSSHEGSSTYAYVWGYKYSRWFNYNDKYNQYGLVPLRAF